MKPSRDILAFFGINGSLRRREVQSQPQPQVHTEYYLFNSAANMKAYSNNGLDFAYYGYNATITQGFLYAPFGEITTEYNANFGSDIIPKYSFNAKELDEETGMYYYEARYYKPPVFTSRDPMFEKYFWMTPYAYCANNPVKYVDPTGMDTLNVTYNNETNKWDISTPIVAAGNDVINVTKSNGIKGSVVFSEGEYGKRICNVTLEDTKEQTLSVFLLSGTGIAGFAVEPPGITDNSKNGDNGEIAPMECGIYHIGSVGGDKWKGWPEQYNNSSGSNLLSKGRGVAIHYAWSKLSISQKNLKAKKWTTKCAVVSSSYSKNAKGVVLFDGNESKAMAQKVAIYCGATGFKTRNKKYDQCVGIPSDCKVIRIVY